MASYDEDRLMRKVQDHFGPRNPPQQESIFVPLSTLQKIIHEDMTCPICLGPIERTSTVTTCLHRFCSECIEKSLRSDLGPKQHHDCPYCRAKLASRRSTRHDENYDDLTEHFTEVHKRYHQEKKFNVLEYRNLDELRVEQIKKKQRAAISNLPPPHPHQNLATIANPIAKLPSIPPPPPPPLHVTQLLSANPHVPANQQPSSGSKPVAGARKGAASKAKAESHGDGEEGNAAKKKRKPRDIVDNRIVLALVPEAASLPELPEPYLRVPPLMQIRDMKQYLREKFDYMRKSNQSYILPKSIEIVMKHEDKVVVLDDSMAVVDATLMLWDMARELLFFYRLPSSLKS